MVGEGGRVRGIALLMRATALGPHSEALGGRLWALCGHLGLLK